MKKKNLILIIAAVALLIILIFFIIILGDKKLDINSQKVTNLHASLGEVDINKCGGLITYSDKNITANDLDIDNKLCKAFYELKDNQKSSKTTQNSEKNSNGISICKIGENIAIATTDDDEKECSYQIIESSDLEEAYISIYGDKLDSEESFYISNKEACYKEGERYYCGNAENFKLSIAPEATIFRLINKAIEHTNGEIIIYDYFLKISNNTCYSTNTNNENKECSKELVNIKLEDDKDVISLVKKYGSIYKHTFKEDKNKNHYWFKTEINK